MNANRDEMTAVYEQVASEVLSGKLPGLEGWTHETVTREHLRLAAKDPEVVKAMGEHLATVTGVLIEELPKLIERLSERLTALGWRLKDYSHLGFPTSEIEDGDVLVVYGKSPGLWAVRSVDKIADELGVSMTVRSGWMAQIVQAVTPEGTVELGDLLVDLQLFDAGEVGVVIGRDAFLANAIDHWKVFLAVSESSKIEEIQPCL